MYWLVLVLSISGMPDINMQVKMGSYFTCYIANQKFIDGNPTSIFVKGKAKKSNLHSIECVKKD